MPQLVGDLPAARVTLQELIDIIAFVRTDVPERHFGRGDERRHKVYPRPAVWALGAGGDREGDGAVRAVVEVQLCATSTNKTCIERGKTPAAANGKR